MLIGRLMKKRSRTLLPLISTISLFCLGDSSAALTDLKRPPFARQSPQESDNQRLFQALQEIGNGRFQQGRALLKELMEPDNPLMPVALLITADSLYREGGSYNIRDATGHYHKWLELFPQDQLAPQVMLKEAEIYLRLSSFRDSGTNEALAERTLQKLRTRFPEFESAEVVDYLDAVQEVRADHELSLARFYAERRDSPAAAGMRLSIIVEKCPRYTKMDEALWFLARAEEAEEKADVAIKHYVRIVQDYPNSVFRTGAENRLRYYDIPVPASDPRVSADLPERLARIARVLADLRGDYAKPRGRGIVLSEWDQADSGVIYDLIGRLER